MNGPAGADVRRPLRPTGFTVLYDADCPVCRRARRWVETHRHLVPLRFVPAGSAAAVRRFPDLDVGGTLVDITVVTDEGAVLRGDRAWIAVLWAMADTRSFAVRLAAGRGRRRFRTVKGATDAIRRFSAGQRDPGPPPRAAGQWPPPRVEPTEGVCAACRT